MTSDRISCPECKDTYEDIAIHWRQSGCSPPPLQSTERSTIAGCLLAGGMLRLGSHSQQAFLEYNTNNQEIAEWLQSELGFIGQHGTVYTHERGSGNTYRVRTLTHPDLYGFESIQTPGESTTRLPTKTDLEETYEWDRTGSDIELTRQIARTWYTLAGSPYQRVSPPIPQLRSRRATASETEWHDLLTPFSPRVYDDRVRLQDAVAWFEFIGWEPPTLPNPPWLRERDVKDGTRCPDCGKYYKQVKLHWAQSACSEPEDSTN